MAKNTHVRQWLDSPYQPEMGTGVDVQERIAKALEYSAHHLFQINQKMDSLISETSNVVNETSNVGGMIMLYCDKDS